MGVSGPEIAKAKTLLPDMDKERVGVVPCVNQITEIKSVHLTKVGLQHVLL
jgi:hypothetical protein